MSEEENTSENFERRERPSSGWQSASEHRGDRGGRSFDRNDRNDRNDRGGYRRDDRGGRSFDRNDRNDRNDRGGYRRDDRDGGRRFEDRGDRGGRSFDRNDRNDRGGRRFEDNDNAAGYRPRDPFVPETVSASDLDKESRRHLMSLSKENAEQVARHLVYAGALMDANPELAYEHAQAAYRHAARIDIVREALGLTAYLNGRYSEALRELRTYRRMTDDYSHVAIEADAERGLGRPEKALAFIAEIPLAKLDSEAQVELALVTSGARADSGDSEGGLSVLEKLKVENLDEMLQARVQLIRADRLEELGNKDEADELRKTWEPVFDQDIAVDLIEDEDDDEDSVESSDSAVSADEADEYDDEDSADADQSADDVDDFESEEDSESEEQE